MRSSSGKQLRARAAFFVVATVSVSLAARTAPSALTPWQGGIAPAVVLSEVLFDPRDGDTAFVEVLNAGSTPAYLDSMVLKIDTTVFVLPRLDTTIAPGARALIRFDGRATVEGRVVTIAKAAP